MKFTKLLSAVAIAALTFSASGAKGIEDIKSNSRIFNDMKTELNNSYISYVEAKDDYQKRWSGKYLFGELIPNILIVMAGDDDADGVKSMYASLKVMDYDMESISQMPIFIDGEGVSFLQEILDNNAINCLRVLQENKFDFKNAEITLEGGSGMSLLDYAKKVKANNEIVKLLKNAGAR